MNTATILRLPDRRSSTSPQGSASASLPEAVLPGYAELHCLTNFSFQRGASSAESLVRRAWALGYEALAITDECSVAGVVRAWKELGLCESGSDAYDEELGQIRSARLALGMQQPMRLVCGSEFRFEGQGTLVALARNLNGWGNLCEVITNARRAATKGQYCMDSLLKTLAALGDCELLWSPWRSAADVSHGQASSFLSEGEERALSDFGVSLLVELNGAADDALWMSFMRELSQATGCPLLAAGDVHMHVRSAKRLHDVMTAIRLGKSVQECGFELQANAERHLRPRGQLADVYSSEFLTRTLAVAERCTFLLTEVCYNYPRETVLEGLTPMETLERYTREGAVWRFPEGPKSRIQGFIDAELKLIAECNYEMFFLTVYDIVRKARSMGILCQGRGSAANSVVCYCLGITEADPRVSNPLLARFISRQRRHEPPDIDVDFEHERREEVIQYIYGKYGRDRAALAATVICYRRRSALRDVGKALGIDIRLIDVFAKDHHWFDTDLAAHRLSALAQDVGTTLTEELAALWLELTNQLRGAPRHLSQHVGGFVLTETPLHRLVPLEPAAMEKRQIIQWDKDDLDALSMMKVDVLALGMLTAVRRCLDMVSAQRGKPFTCADIQHECPETYRMIQKADTVGTFQIESRAQMSMLPRLRPDTFYDLVVQVAIVRPGPISGGMVHPYLKARERRRQGLPIEYERSSKDPPPNHKNHLDPASQPQLSKALERTLGIPIFQEQVMELAMIAAGYSAEGADKLRRDMAAWKRKGGLGPHREKLISGMLKNGYKQEYAERIFKQIEGFGEYGFPESHAYSFALIAYQSSWLKCHEPEAFLAAMLNSQPMGFYGPSQLIQDAQRHDVVVLPSDVTVSDWDCTLECVAPGSASRSAVRLGLRLVKGFGEAAGAKVVESRRLAPFASVNDLCLRADLESKDINSLASADALRSLSGHRRQQVWQASAERRAPGLLREAPVEEAALSLPAALEGEEIVHDYATLGLSLRNHPLALLRERLARRGVLSAAELNELPHGRRVTACGLVIGRQQPGTAKGTIFVTLEDETGPVNVIVWKSARVDEEQRNALLRSHLLAVEGEWQKDESSGGLVRHLIAQRMHDLTPLLGRLAESTSSRDFH
ncbi:error-prone DNA polymerase [Ottowia thiooxydans]|uniref:error-prone DNA polymerase n=1 Tax=Ottowia thiooxydans TaxID=219182 RepID=UPI0003FF5042|nr:error-prone DNA polymerase [Ottowia thiooxydans]